MREIKFRGKRVDNGEWVHGFLIKYAFDGTSKTIHVGIQKEGCYPIEIDPETIGQYTGLKDKNGVKIYFNSDKVRGRDSHGKVWVGIVDNSDPYCTGLKMDDGDFIPLHVFAYSEPFEIIGNIHEANK